MHQGRSTKLEARKNVRRAAAEDLASLSLKLPVDVPGERFIRDRYSPATGTPHPEALRKVTRAMATLLGVETVAKYVSLMPNSKITLSRCSVAFGVAERFDHYISIGIDPANPEKGPCLINEFPWSPEEYFSKADVANGKAAAVIGLLITDEIITGPRSLAALVRARVDGTRIGPVKAKRSR